MCHKDLPAGTREVIDVPDVGKVSIVSSLDLNTVVSVFRHLEWATILIDAISIGFEVVKYPTKSKNDSTSSWLLVSPFGEEYRWHGSWDFDGLLSADNVTICSVKSAIDMIRLK